MKANIKDFLFYQLPPWLWGLGIFVGTSLPTDYLPEVILLSPDKLLHAGVFLVFSILVYRAVSFLKKHITTRRSIFITLVITVCYAIFDELHQYFVPGRSPDPFDVLADIIGIAAGLLLVVLYQVVIERKQKQIDVESRHSTIS